MAHGRASGTRECLSYIHCVAEPREGTVYELTCPHCRREFSGELLQGGAERYRGFKCPHCRLFVPWERAQEQLAEQPS
jgi:DNA-directed RNA polymerase subunit RPC12/RpoP